MYMKQTVTVLCVIWLSFTDSKICIVGNMYVVGISKFN